MAGVWSKNDDVSGTDPHKSYLGCKMQRRVRAAYTWDGQADPLCSLRHRC